MELTLSLLVPCYNAAAFLPEFLESIQKQQSPFDEVIFYDDASDDDTAAILRESGATVIEGSRNMGAAYARNRLLDATKAQWVHFHDVDDSMDPEFVKICKEQIINDQLTPEDRTCLLSDMAVCEKASGNHIQVTRYIQADIDDDTVRYFLTNTGYAIVGCYPTQLLQSINGFSESLRGNEDPDLHLRLAMAKTKFRCLQRALVTNHVRSDSFSSKNFVRCLTDRFACYTGYLMLLPKYKKEIGKELFLIGAWYFYHGYSAEGDEVLRVIKDNDIRYSQYTGGFGHHYSKALGIEAYFQQLKFRNTLNCHAKAIRRAARIYRNSSS